MTVGPRIAIAGAVATLAVGLVGLIVSLVLHVFVFDEFDAYGEVPVPGSGRLHLPAGEVTISFHTLVAGGVDGGFPLPPLQLGMTAPDGVPDPVLTESMGSTTSVNSDVRVRVWVAQLAGEGVYDIEAAGQVNGYIDPRLAFGRDSSPGWMPWLFGGLLAAGLAELAFALTWMARSGRRPQPVRGPVSLDAPTEQGGHLSELQSLARLRDCGALTEDEFQAEKRRLLGG